MSAPDRSLVGAAARPRGWIERFCRPVSGNRRTSFGDIAIVAISALFLGIFLVIPLATIFSLALKNGIHAYFRAVTEPYARSAIWLTFVTAAVVLPINLGFGLAAGWAIGKFEFRGKEFLTTLIDLPFAVSPVIGGMLFVLLFGAQGIVGPWLIAHGVKIIFAKPGIILATMFVTSPFVARELIPVMQASGSEEEQAAISLGAGGWQTFFRVTLPNVKWGVLYGVILCNARAIGEFGAVSVVSGNISGLTSTMPLYIEVLYDDYNFSAAFAVSSLLSLVAVLTLVAKRIVGRHVGVGTAASASADEELAA